MGDGKPGALGLAGAWAVLRASSVESRFEALHATGLTILVGRPGPRRDRSNEKTNEPHGYHPCNRQGVHKVRFKDRQ